MTPLLLAARELLVCFVISSHNTSKIFETSKQSPLKIIIINQCHILTVFAITASNGAQGSTFTTVQQGQIATEVAKITETQLLNDIWGTAYGLMKGLETKSGFSSGVYSIIMSQSSFVRINGYLCRMGNSFYNSQLSAGAIIPDKFLGAFYIFQTRLT